MPLRGVRARAPAPPAGPAATDNRRYLLWSTDGFPAIVNGRSSLNPAFTRRLIERVEPFPDRRTVAFLSRLGVNSVVLHANRVNGTPWEAAAHRPVAGLGVTRRDLGDLVVYEIRSPSGGRATRRSVARLARRSR